MKKFAWLLLLIPMQSLAAGPGAVPNPSALFRDFVGASTISYVPPLGAAYVSSDGSGNAGTWQPLTGSGGQSINSVPPALGLMYSTDGTGNAGTWAYCTTSCGGGGGGGGVTSINTVAGAFTFTGAGVNCVTTTCTFSGGSGTINTGTLARPAVYSGTTALSSSQMLIDASQEAGADIGAKLLAAINDAIAVNATGRTVINARNFYTLQTTTTNWTATLPTTGECPITIQMPAIGITQNQQLSAIRCNDFVIDGFGTNGNSFIQAGSSYGTNCVSGVTTCSGTLTVTAYSITSNVASITAANSLIAGQIVTLSGFGTSTFLNGDEGIVSATGLSGAGFQMTIAHANASATEAGSATIDAPLFTLGNCNSVSTGSFRDGIENWRLQANANLPGTMVAMCGAQEFTAWNKVGIFGNNDATQTGAMIFDVGAANQKLEDIGIDQTGVNNALEYGCSGNNCYETSLAIRVTVNDSAFTNKGVSGVKYDNTPFGGDASCFVCHTEGFTSLIEVGSGARISAIDLNGTGTTTVQEILVDAGGYIDARVVNDYGTATNLITDNRLSRNITTAANSIAGHSGILAYTNGNSFLTGGTIDGMTIGAITPSTVAATTVTATSGVAVTSDGVHAGGVALVGNTTLPTLTTGAFNWIGPNSASVTAFGWQMPTATNGSAGIAHVGANSAGVSQVTVSAVAAADLAAIAANSAFANATAGSAAPAVYTIPAGFQFYTNGSGYTAGTAAQVGTLFNIATNAVLKSGGTAAAPVASSMMDNGTNVTSTDTGGYVAPVFVANGTTAGFLDLPQGPTSAAVAPCNVATSICIQAPTSVTSYLEVLPSASATGFEYGTNSANVRTVSFGELSGDVTSSGSLATTVNNVKGVPQFLPGVTTAAMSGQTTATCTNVTNMTWTIAANKNYILRCEIPMTLAASATIQYCIGGPGTATSYSLIADGDLGTAGIWSQISTLAQTAYGTKTGASAAVAANTVQHVWAGIQNGATASGTALTLQTAANGTNAITVGANATCTLTQTN